jgi:hypothetical protein
MSKALVLRCAKCHIEDNNIVKFIYLVYHRAISKFALLSRLSLYQVRVITVFTVFRLLTDFVALLELLEEETFTNFWTDVEIVIIFIKLSLNHLWGKIHPII